MNDEIRNLIFQAIDRTISREDFERLQDAIETHESVRTEYLMAVNLSESLSDIAFESLPVHDAGPTALAADRIAESPAANAVDSANPNSKRQRVTRTDTLNAHGRPFLDYASGWKWNIASISLAAAILIAVGAATFWLGRGTIDRSGAQLANGNDPVRSGQEQTIDGYATLRRAVGVQWPDNATKYREGDILPSGILQFGDGVAEIDFFCGATLIVDGPAKLELESDWSVRVLAGRLRANVPPAARGFVVKAADSEIIDLGTEFALEVDSECARVEVIDGEVELRGGQSNGKHLVTGDRQSLKGAPSQQDNFDLLTTGKELQRRRDDSEAQRFAQWKKHSQQLRTDSRLIAYFAIAEAPVQRVVPNTAFTGHDFDGQLVGPVDRTHGRFGAKSTGLEFDRPGSRVRTRIDGSFQAFTFTCWVRIDSLEHNFNSLFMGDSYENGEPHWQIRKDGSLMFSVMVDDTQQNQHFSELEQQMVTQAGLHRLYYTKPFWDISKSGQWFHLVAVYDPADRRVVQYVNGEQVASEVIIDKFYIETLHIGAAEIGNWGQPFRKTPSFAVRNLHGTIDELAIYNAALTSDEIQELYEQGKPLGY